ncbi:MAG TPA: class I SAM-dependent methyltransferase [Thermoanaerobaculia bacterium]|nr:class I SAM-dependent methyltransferase [Thermoanaerobaculia bacterium]
MPNVYQFKDFDGSSHRILIDLIRRFGGKGRLIDLGAAGGELCDAVRSQFHHTLGFEYDVNRAGDLRKRFDQVVIADLERVIRLPKNSDVIVMADVLEHLRNPSAVLNVVREALDANGTLFLSVPNIANITIRIGLLFGTFTYRDRGILDHTHLRFYTRRTILEELRRAGFHVAAVRGSSVPVRLIVGGMVPDLLLRPIEKILSWATQSWKSLLAYQIIVVATPTHRG